MLTKRDEPRAGKLGKYIDLEYTTKNLALRFYNYNEEEKTQLVYLKRDLSYLLNP